MKTGSSSSAPENHVLEGSEEEEEVEFEEEGPEEEDEPSDQKLVPFRLRLVRDLEGTGDLKHESCVTGVTGCFRSPVNQAGFSVGVPVRFGAGYSVNESSTKWDSHSSSANSSVGTESSLGGRDPNPSLLRRRASPLSCGSSEETWSISW